MTTATGERPAVTTIEPIARHRRHRPATATAELPAWWWPGLGLVGAASAVLYAWNITASGFGNEYYAAAVLAATRSWSAFFFGSFDASNFITVDKPPLALWLMAISARIFGFSQWTVMLPQAVAGAASVVALAVIVGRSFGRATGLLAAVMFGLTPVAVLMFRFNDPDALLTLLLILAAGAFLRGIESGRTRWFAAAAALLGLGFLTKSLQADIVAPAFALALLVAGPGRLGRRLRDLGVAAAVAIAASGWWPLLVDLIPAGSRPFIGGSTTNSTLDLIFGYNGLGRITGSESGVAQVGGYGGVPGFSGAPGLFRMFNDVYGGQVAWLIPLAFIGLAVGVVVVRQRARSDVAVAGLALWGGWLVCQMVVLGLAEGIIHTYYAVVLAPAVAALAALAMTWLWAARATLLARLSFGGAVIVTAAWALVFLDRTPAFLPWLGALLIAGGCLAAALMLVPEDVPAVAGRPRSWRRPSAPAAAAAALALVVVLAGPTSYALATAGRAYGGGDPQAGPAPARGFGFGLGGVGFGGVGSGGPRPGFGFGRVAGGDAGVSTALATFLVANRGSAAWILATNGSTAAASLELATGQPVMAMGGFNGSDPTPTAQQLATWVAQGRLRFIAIGGNGPGAFGGGDASASARSAWVTSHCAPLTAVAGAGAGSIYDCGPGPG